MCLTVPCEVVRVDGLTAVVERAGVHFDVSLIFLDETVRPGDFLAVQAQRHAHAVLSRAEAEDILRFYDRLGEILDRDEAANA